MKKMTIVGIDPSINSAGLSVGLTDNDKNLDFTVIATVKSGNTKQLADKIVAINNAVDSLVPESEAIIIITEEPTLYKTKLHNTIVRLSMSAGAYISSVVRKTSLPILITNMPMEWKGNKTKNVIRSEWRKIAPSRLHDIGHDAMESAMMMIKYLNPKKISFENVEEETTCLPI